MKQSLRRKFFKKIGFGALSISLFGKFSLPAWAGKSEESSAEKSVFLTTGFKFMEVSANSVMVWTRVCGQESPNPIRHERREEVFRHPINFDESMPVSEMDGGVVGAKGFVQVKLIGASEEYLSSWVEALEENDFTVKIPFDGLASASNYEVELLVKSEENAPTLLNRGSFKTSPDPENPAPLLFTTSTCQYFWSFDEEKRGFHSYDSMTSMKPDFFIQTGDYVYYDKPGPLAKNLEQACHKWHAMDAWPSLKDLFKTVPVYMMKDDHDLLKDDSNPSSSAYGDLTFEDGVSLWYQNVPLPGKPYRTLRWGKDLQIWMVEGREFRTPNEEPDGPEKTIWGQEQMDWFQESVEASNANFKILITATPIVGPDRDSKSDNHANKAYEFEGEKLRSYLSGIPNLFVINGDRHWQYVSKDLKTGLMEFCSGPISDFHSQGWNADDVRPEHQFLRLKGGFLSVKVERVEDEPIIRFTHHDVMGKAVHETFFRVKG
ncbi:alkaline phosphatase D family protein [Algoriphagus sp. SE2]|uniref:alkaline phosphatase D family protein n=1 Tax=Algoriphagus sp. SE2 TaxID=3141536 RepID=UPI0031CD81A2